MLNKINLFDINNKKEVKKQSQLKQPGIFFREFAQVGRGKMGTMSWLVIR